jgi:hypothetical protein
MSKDKKLELKKEDIYPFLDEYYEKIGRKEPPQFRNYTLHELKKCLYLHGINLQQEQEQEQEIIQDK